MEGVKQASCRRAITLEVGVTSRPLKPANIKVRADGTVKVLDFGLEPLREITEARPSTSADRIGLHGPIRARRPANRRSFTATRQLMASGWRGCWRAEAFQQPGRLIRRRAPKRPIPIAQRVLHLPARRNQLGDLPVDRVEHPLRRCADVVAGSPASLADLQKPGDLGEREAKPLRVPNQR